MSPNATDSTEKSQSEKFKQMVREVGADTDEKRWDEGLKRVAKAKDVPVPEPKGPVREKPGPAKDVGDETPNPLPDKGGEGDGGGDPGRV